MTDPQEQSANASLLPCPFCGGKASGEGTTEWTSRHDAWWGDDTRIRKSYHCNCTNCGITNRGIIGHQTPEQAHAAWNKRAAP